MPTLGCLKVLATAGPGGIGLVTQEAEVERSEAGVSPGLRMRSRPAWEINKNTCLKIASGKRARNEVLELSTFLA